MPLAADAPLMGFYSVSPLTPGAWAGALTQAGLPNGLRRLTELVAVGERHRQVEMRCLSVLPALAWLLSEPDGARESTSVRAWRLAARLVEQVVLSGGEVPDLSRFAGAFPPSAHAVLVAVGPDQTHVTLPADEVLDEFVSSGMRALAAAVREPRVLTAPEVHAEAIDLAVLQPALRAVAPDLGTVAPVVQLRDSLEPLVVELSMPRVPDAPWPLRATPAEPALLARASHIFAPLGRLRGGVGELAPPAVAELRLAAPALEFAGARVVLPPAIAEEQELEFDRAELALGEGSLGLGGAIAYDLHASLGGVDVSEEEFRALAAATQPLVRLGGEWRVLERSSLEKARALAAAALHAGSLPALTALGAALAGAADVRGVPVDVHTARDTALGALVDQLRDPSLRGALDPAPGFHGELRPYQRVGLGWLVRMRRLGLGALLADDMGLGKTVQLIAYLVDRSDTAEGPVLVVCPTSVLGNWEHELHRFAPELSVGVHHGPDRTTRAEDLEAVDVVLTSYALLPRDRRLLCQASWRALVLDEAQAVKNPLTRAAQTARAVTAGHRVALTGTPVENRLEELWSLMHILNPGLLDTRSAFRRRFATPIERRADEGAEARLRAVTTPFILRRRKTDPTVLPDLPPRQESTEHCTLTLEQATLYQATIDAMLGALRGTAGIERRGHVLALLTRLKQVCNHPVQALGRAGALPGRSGKLDRLTEMLAEAVDEGDSALVFTQFAVMGNLLAEHLPRELETERLYFDGSTPRPERERIVQRFQGADEPKVLVLSLRAGGLGLNLTRASHVFHFDRWWNPAVEDQASDRAHRIGQTRVVQVHKLVCAGTIEERIDALIESKRDLAERIVDRGGESAISELSDDEIAELVELRV